MNNRKRLQPKERRKQLIASAVRLAERIGYDRITRNGVAEEAGVSTGLVTHYFRTMKQLQRATMREAVTVGNLSVVAQGLVAGDPQALKAPAELKQAAASRLAEA